jgi:phosphatidylserine/phosphatidylglycerophosphate/cardiolipin synthase-like enzyme
VFVGSFNLDARSALIKSEARLYEQSSELAAQRFEAGLIRLLPLVGQS